MHTPFLDRGAWGVQVPQVNTADETRAAVAAVKYAPEGQRGIFSGGRAASYGFKGTTADYAREASRPMLNRETTLWSGGIPMKRATSIAIALLLAACSSMPSWVPGGGWTTLIDGDKGLDNFSRVGDANWRTEDGAIVADKGQGGFLLTKNSYRDFQIRAEFWAERNTNSGIFIRIQDPKKIGADNSYEVNIYDQRPGPEYSTAGIVNFAKVPVPPIYKAEGKWNTFEITAKGSNIVVMFNGTRTVDIQEGKFTQGPFALQFGNHGKEPGGAIRWRKVQVKEL